MHIDILLYFKARIRGAVGCSGTGMQSWAGEAVRRIKLITSLGYLMDEKKERGKGEKIEASIITEKRERRRERERKRGKKEKKQNMNKVNYYFLLFCLQTE